MSTDQSLFSIRRHVSEFALAGARLSFAAAIILIPVRARLVLVPRRVPAIPADYTDFLLFAADVAVVLMLAFWVMSLIVLPRRLSLGPRTIWIPLAGLVLAGFASSVRSYDPLLSVYHAIRLAGLFWFYVFVVNEIRSIRWVLIPVGIQIMIESTVALGQFVVQHSVGLQSVGELYLDPTRHGVSVVAADGIRLLRAYGLSDHPNILGGCLAFGLLLIIPAYVQGKSRWFALAALLPAGPALLVTFSRSAWLAFVVGVLLLILLAFVSRRTISLSRFASLGLAWLLLILPIVLTYPRFFGVRLNASNSFSTPSIEQQSIGERMLLMQSAGSMIADHPVFGVGLGAAPLALKAYRPDWPVGYEPPHVAWLEAAVETGLPGAMFYLVLMVAPLFAYCARGGLAVADPPAAAIIALLLAISVVGLFDYYTWLLVPGRLWQWLAFGLWAAASIPSSPLVSDLSKSQPNKISSTIHVSPTA